MEDGKVKAYDPGTWFWFSFMFIDWAFLLNYLGAFQGDSTIPLGLMCLVNLPVFLAAGNWYAKAGNGFFAMYVYVFGMLFCGLFGAVSAATGYFILQGVVFDFALQGIVFLIGGIFLAVTLPSLVYADKANLVTWTFCTIWCIAGGLSYLGVAPGVTYMASLMGCAVTTAGVTYMTLDATIAQCYGFHLPMGRPFKEMGDWDK